MYSLCVPQICTFNNPWRMLAGDGSALDDSNTRQLEEIEARLEGLPSSVRSADPSSALEELADLIDAAEGEWATALGSFVRSAGIVSDLVDLIDHDDAEIYALAMRVLANLCSDAVDPHSSATKEVVRTYNGFSRLLPHCYNEDPVALMYTLGAIQNLCTNIEYARMVTPALRERICEIAEFATGAALGENIIPEALAGLLVHYAEGILVNIAMCERELPTHRRGSRGELLPEARPDVLRHKQSHFRASNPPRSYTYRSPPHTCSHHHNPQLPTHAMRHKSTTTCAREQPSHIPRTVTSRRHRRK